VVFVRFFPVAKLSWSDEVVEWAFAWLVFMGAAALWRTREHFCVDALACKLQRCQAGLIQQLLIELICAGFFVLFAYYSYLLTMKANDRSPILEWPRILWYASMPLAGVIMAGCSLQGIIRVLTAFFNPRLACPDDLREALASEAKEAH
jgi:TRAP-type C4-dicarboxylate transport system permease small subunit